LVLLKIDSGGDHVQRKSLYFRIFSGIAVAVTMSSITVAMDGGSSHPDHWWVRHRLRTPSTRPSTENPEPTHVVRATTSRISAVLPTTNDWFGQSKYGLMFHYIPEVGRIAAGPEGTWNTTVQNFNVTRFVNDVQKTGAAYVVFSIGQVSGYYAAPNSYYEKITGSQNGMYTSKRDLIADLAAALNQVGIKLMLYAAVEGPSAAPESIRAAFPVPDDTAGPARRASINAMLREWSLRWSTNVVGWWLDGCYPGTGYDDVTGGEEAVGELLRAVKAGNSTAVAACNPKVLQFRGQSTEQDYVAGEEYELQRYPATAPLHFKGKSLTWHVMSYLGTNWGKQDVRYPEKQVASYIKNVSDRGGVVTLDLGINADGSLSSAQVEAMSAVKAMVRESGIPPDDNLALYKPVAMVSNTNGQQLPYNGNIYEHYAHYAVDGSTTGRDAQGSKEWAWSLMVDLNQAESISRAEITFPQANFPTKGAIEVLTTGGTWTKFVDIAVATGGTYTFKGAPVRGRYVRVRSETPNGPDQLGGQMAITEVKLFGR
jgi:F5/8 type C domain/Alpha-L-fucosidase